MVLFVTTGETSDRAASVTNSFSVGWSKTPDSPKERVYPKSILGTSLGKVQWGSLPCSQGCGLDPGQGAVVIIGSHAGPRATTAEAAFATTRGSVPQQKIPV